MDSVVFVLVVRGYFLSQRSGVYLCPIDLLLSPNLFYRLDRRERRIIFTKMYAEEGKRVSENFSLHSPRCFVFDILERGFLDAA